MTLTLEKRFRRSVRHDGALPRHCPELGRCHIWTASLTTLGYGKIGVTDVTVGHILSGRTWRHVTGIQ